MWRPTVRLQAPHSTFAPGAATEERLTRSRWSQDRFTPAARVTRFIEARVRHEANDRCPRIPVALIRERVVDRYDSLDLEWLAVAHRRVIAPLTDCVQA